MASSPFHNALIVEDSAPLQKTLSDLFTAQGVDIASATTVADAKEHLDARSFDLVVLDFCLPDGDGFDVLAHIASLQAMPAVVAMSGTAAPEQSFRLAQLGVRAFVQKPIRLDAFESCLRIAAESPPDLTPLLRAAVGHVGVKEVEAQVRETMVGEALGRTDGSRRGAAKLLSISRQLLQHILRKDV